MLQSKQKVSMLFLSIFSIFLQSNQWKHNLLSHCSSNKNFPLVYRNINQTAPKRISFGGVYHETTEEYISLAGSTPILDDLNYNFQQGFEKIVVSKFTSNTDGLPSAYTEVTFNFSDTTDIVPVHPGAIVYHPSDEDYYVIGTHAPYENTSNEKIPSRFTITKLDTDLTIDVAYPGHSSKFLNFSTDCDATTRDTYYYKVNAATLHGNKLYFVGTISDYDINSDYKTCSFIACYNIKDNVWIIEPQVIESAGEDLELVNFLLDAEDSKLYVCGSKGTQGIVGKFAIKPNLFEIQDSSVSQSFTSNGFFEEQQIVDYAGGFANGCIWDMQLVKNEGDTAYILAVGSEIESTISYLQTVTVFKIKASNGQLATDFGNLTTNDCGDVIRSGYQKHYFDEITLQYPFDFNFVDSAWIKNVVRHFIHVTSNNDIFVIGGFANYVTPFVYKLNAQGLEKKFKNVFGYTINDQDEIEATLSASPLFYPALSREWGTEMEAYSATILTDDTTLRVFGTQAQVYRYEGSALIHESKKGEVFNNEFGIFKIDESQDITKEIDLSRNTQISLSLDDDNSNGDENNGDENNSYNGFILHGECHYDSARSVLTITDFTVPDIQGLEDISNVQLQLHDGILHHTFPENITTGELTVNAEVSFLVEEIREVVVPLSGVMTLHFYRNKIVSIDPLILAGELSDSDVSLVITQFDITHTFNQVTHNQHTIMDHFSDLFFNN